MHKAQVQITTPLQGGSHKQQAYLSYNSTHDRPVAVGIFNSLQRYDVQSFLDMPPGVSWEHMLKNDFKRVDIMVLIVTHRSLEEIAQDNTHPLLLDYEQALLAAERDDVSNRAQPTRHACLQRSSPYAVYLGRPQFRLLWARGGAPFTLPRRAIRHCHPNPVHVAHARRLPAAPRSLSSCPSSAASGRPAGTRRRTRSWATGW